MSYLITRKRFFVLIVALVTALAGLQVWAVYKLDIETRKPVYFDRQGKDWESKSRFIGLIANPTVDFTLDIIEPSTAKVLQTKKFIAGINIYESDWLPIGTYNLAFKAEGYRDGIARGSILKGKTDCRIDIKFCVD